MKTQIITFGLLLAAISFTSCKNNEGVPQETPAATEAPIQTNASQTDTTKQTAVPDKAAEKASENGEKGENEAQEKNEK
ncbi:hypothetical protein [Flavobacterium sp.]|uniref:hypothetical protein n=1 Tax=Flavobacterium sp. TaxID=239 RepID=UPI00260AFDE5|nr:hypothetical protein [Flavobacterium sp.]